MFAKVYNCLGIFFNLFDILPKKNVMPSIRPDIRYPAKFVSGASPGPVIT
jgi:hypothetical protein